jgi:hypothetical protein
MDAWQSDGVHTLNCIFCKGVALPLKLEATRAKKASWLK